MRSQLPLVLLPLITLCAPAWAGTKEVAPPPLEPPAAPLYTRVTLETSYTGEGELELEDGNAKYGESDTWYARAGFEQTIPINAEGKTGWFGRVGLRYSYLGIGESTAPLPDMLQSISVPLALEYRTESEVPLPKFSITMNPGLYFAEDMDSNDFDIPTFAYYGFDFTPELRVLVGAGGGLFSKNGVLPGGGLIWRFNRAGMLSLTFPQGGIYIFPNKNLELFAGAEWFSQTHRVDREADFPGPLQDALLGYREIRASVGVKYRATENMSVALTGGYTLDREWDYERAGVTFEQGNAPFVKASLELRF